MLTSLIGPINIKGGSGNSFYDLTALSPTAAHGSTIVGGSSTAGNSEVAFNNLVLTTAGTLNISHIQILDDVSNILQTVVPFDQAGHTATLQQGGESQGGFIDMNNFPGLQSLNQPYALLAEDLQPWFGSGGERGKPEKSEDGQALAPPQKYIPVGLPFTVAQFNFTPPAS